MLNTIPGSTLKIEYRSADEFEIEYKKEIYAESESLIQDHLWWNEPFTLYDQIQYPLYLTGESNLIIDTLNDEFSVRRQIERADDIYMAMGDYLKIIAVLETISANHELDWHLFYTNQTDTEVTIGAIVNGRADEASIQYIINSIALYHIPFEQISDNALREGIYSKYFDQNDDPIFDELT
ncbi:MAG: hypothetical protein ACSHX8_03460 [Opitutaceae bacterium]